MIFATVRQLQKGLAQLDKWLEAATTHAQQKSFDPNLYLGFRLAPDQYPLARQVQSACDTVKMGAARLAAKEWPKQADDETTVDQLRARIRSVTEFLDTFAATDFEGAAKLTIALPRWEGRVMSGQDYFLEHVMPNFYFHLTHAYAILRHNGVPLGKRDYLGKLTLVSPS